MNIDDQGWGTVCDDHWMLPEADVACRMAGFTSAVAAPTEALFGAGSGRIWLDDVFCHGNESTLLQCSYAGLGVHNCKHSEDAAVVCSRESPPPWPAESQLSLTLPPPSPEQAVCPYFEVTHGNFSSATPENHYVSGVAISVTCDPNYFPRGGVASVSCSSTGVWAPYTPQCGSKPLPL